MNYLTYTLADQRQADLRRSASRARQARTWTRTTDQNSGR
jgi:hypothetical protein